MEVRDLSVWAERMSRILPALCHTGRPAAGPEPELRPSVEVCVSTACVCWPSPERGGHRVSGSTRHAVSGYREAPSALAAADNLRFVEFERKALPCALMRPSNGQRSLYSYSAADMDARSVMEQRLQAMVCCFSMVQRVLARQPVWTVGALGNTSATTSTTTSSANTTQGRSSSSTGTASNSNSNSSGLECGSEGLLPIRAVPSGEAAERVWRYLSAVPALMEVRESSDSIGCSSMHLLQGVVF
jgi:hypothetical protein